MPGNQAETLAWLAEVIPVCKKGDKSTSKAILKKIKSLDQDSVNMLAGPQRMTMLHLAVMHGRNDFVDALLARGADPMVVNFHGFVPAELTRDEKMIAKLDKVAGIEPAPPPPDNTQSTAAHGAAQTDEGLSAAERADIAALRQADTSRILNGVADSRSPFSPDQLMAKLEQKYIKFDKAFFSDVLDAALSRDGDRQQVVMALTAVAKEQGFLDKPLMKSILTSVIAQTGDAGLYKTVRDYACSDRAKLLTSSDLSAVLDQVSRKEIINAASNQLRSDVKGGNQFSQDLSRREKGWNKSGRSFFNLFKRRDRAEKELKRPAGPSLSRSSDDD